MNVHVVINTDTWKGILDKVNNFFLDKIKILKSVKKAVM